MKPAYPLYLAGQPVELNTDLPVTDKFTGQIVTRVALADAATVETAISGAVRAVEPMRRMRPFERQAVLDHCVRSFEERREEFAASLCIEAGKPIRDARTEVSRLIETFRIASGESVRIGGDVLNLERSARSRGYRGMTQRVPVGVCSLISPFNFPLNLAAHKIAPAIAAGCPFLLKPASKTPVGALLIGEVLAETPLPPGAFSILPCSRDAAEPFVTDDRIRLLSFTGSPEAGWELKSKAGKKRVVLELGGNAACIVDRDADIDDAVRRLIIGAFYQSGQSCISVQRIIVHDAVIDELRTKLTAAARSLVVGDPSDEATFIGPLIDESSAMRLRTWIDEALTAGGRLLCGGNSASGSQLGCLMPATLLEDVPRHCRIVADEAFGPVAVLSRFRKFADALAEANDSRYGLQAGVFTRDIQRAMTAWDSLEVGGVIINDVPSWRVDHMPYGGVKDSGQGREGIRSAIDEMTEPRLLVIREDGRM